MVKWDLSDTAHDFVWIRNWEQAFAAVSKLDQLKSGEDRSLIQGKAALRIVAEYGLMYYKCAVLSSDSKIRLRLIIDGNTVYTFLSLDGVAGVFIYPYDAELHGDWVEKLDKNSLYDFNNIEARLEGWSFYARVLAEFKEGQS